MAVTTTPQDLIDAAYAKSMKNMPGQIASESTELLQVVIRTLRKFYAIAARVNPTFFASSETVAAPGSDTPWDRPETAESIFRLEEADGTEIVVVPFDDRTAESGKPAVYRLGQQFYDAGNASDPDPATDSIKFWFSKRPSNPSTLSATIDSMWVEQFNELPILEIALYLAFKDAGTTGRDIETQGLVMSRDDWLRQFILFLEHETSNERKRFGHLRRFNTQSLIPLTDLLVGGSTVDLSRGSE